MPVRVDDRGVVGHGPGSPGGGDNMGCTPLHGAGGHVMIDGPGDGVRPARYGGGFEYTPSLGPYPGPSLHPPTHPPTHPNIVTVTPSETPN